MQSDAELITDSCKMDALEVILPTNSFAWAAKVAKFLGKSLDSLPIPEER